MDEAKVSVGSAYKYYKLFKKPGQKVKKKVPKKPKQEDGFKSVGPKHLEPEEPEPENNTILRKKYYCNACQKDFASSLDHEEAVCIRCGSHNVEKRE